MTPMRSSTSCRPPNTDSSRAPTPVSPAFGPALRHRINVATGCPGSAGVTPQWHAVEPGEPLMRAVFDAGPGAVVSHTTAAAWWGLPGFDLLTVHITRPLGAPPGAPTEFADHVHEVLDLTADQVTVLDGVPAGGPSE